MKITRTGYYKDKGTSLLVDAPMPEMGEPSWCLLRWRLTMLLAGPEGRSTYEYAVEFSADELALMVENALMESASDKGVDAQAKAIGDYIREILDEKHHLLKDLES